MALTSVHHAYGAFVYGTPWRLHAALIGAVAAPLMLAALAALRRRDRLHEPDTFAFWSFVLLVFFLPVAAIGIFEGAYNHVAKNLIYFSGAPAALMHALYPPGLYELPDDVFFEATGVLQTFPALIAGWHLARLIGARRSRTRRGDRQ